MIRKSLLAFVFTALCAHADEGMWLYSAPPREALRERYGFAPNDAWLQHLQQASVRFNSGGSGAFVSSDGLVITNHHVGVETLQKLSTRERDLVENGFYAATLREELKAPDLELNVLLRIEDVTARVNAAITAGLPDSEAFAKRRAVIAEIEKEGTVGGDVRCDVVSLFQGAQYHLYQYKRYTDVRLVFAPEQQMAFFGGDPDNFEYPRFDFDICFFRAYENGKPAKPPHYLAWSGKGTKPGDLVFVSGHPGDTSRLLTVAELEDARDHELPLTLQRLFRREVNLTAFSARSLENGRRAGDELFGVQNGRKAQKGALEGLLDPGLFGRKVEAENRFRVALAQRAAGKAALEGFERIAKAQESIRAIRLRYQMLEGARGFACDSFSLARTLVRAAAEWPKPNGERLDEYSDASRVSLELGLFSEKPIYTDLEIATLADSLTQLAEAFGASSPLVQRVYAGKPPTVRAAELIHGTAVRDVAFRRRLANGGSAVLREVMSDPMIALAAEIDAESREVRSAMEAQTEAKRQAHAQIAAARFALFAAGGYPDATFTLRLAFGTVRGYNEAERAVPPYTTFEGLYARAHEQQNLPPFDLAPRWIEGKKRLQPSTPLNFVCTADIIGGNSGSPVVDRDGEFVGIIFDGNIQSLVLDFVYDDVRARAVCVDARGIYEALDVIYGARTLLCELSTGSLP